MNEVMYVLKSEIEEKVSEINAKIERQDELTKALIGCAIGATFGIATRYVYDRFLKP